MERTLRTHAQRIFRAALKASDPHEAVCRHVTVERNRLIAGKRRCDLDAARHIWVIGGGKAGAPMAQAVEKLLGRRISGGVLNVKYGHQAKLRRIELNECGHPVPDENGLRVASRIAETARNAGADDLVICLIEKAVGFSRSYSMSLMNPARLCHLVAGIMVPAAPATTIYDKPGFIRGRTVCRWRPG